MDYDRRDFLKSVGVAAALLPAAREAEAATAPVKYVPAFRHFLDVDGYGPDELFDLVGGNYRGLVTTSYLGPSNVSKKSITYVVVDEVTVAVGAGLSRGVYQWIIATMGRNATPRNGDYLSADAQGNLHSLTTFFDAVITKVAFPPLDIHDKTPSTIALSFVPASIRKNTSTNQVTAAKPKPLMASNFRLTISGLETSCEKVTQIESFFISQEVSYPLGFLEVSPLNVSDLVFYCPEEFAGDFVAFADDFLGNGNHLEANEKTGTLDFLGPDKKSVLMTLTFFGLGIYGLTLEGDDSKTVAGRVMKVQMYCETVSMAVIDTSG
jgi:hypothetical protein